MKKHWKVLLGASLATGLASSLFMNKKRKTQEQPSLTAILIKQYVGSWWFIDQQKRTQHSLLIDDALTIYVDNRQIVQQLVELSANKLVIQDEYGYHLIIKTKNKRPYSLYDEADDITFLLEETN